MDHHCSLRVRSYECDFLGHVNNAVYLNYLEYARHELMLALGTSLDGLKERGFSLIVARICIDYKREARMGDELEIVTRPLRRGRSSGTFRQTIYREREVVADAEVVWVCLDARGRPTRFPPELDRPELAP